MTPIHVIGLGLGPEDLPDKTLAVLESAQVIAGGLRQLDCFSYHAGRRIPLKGNLSDWLDQVERAAVDQTVAVLASGDPGFYGVASQVVDRVGADKVTIHPNVSSLQAAFARLKEPWNDATVISLHGRDERVLFGSLNKPEKIAVFTDPVNSPARIARLLLSRGQNHWRMSVLEDLGTEHERVSAYSLEDAARETFSPLNIVVLKRWKWPEVPRLGAPEQWYRHEAGLITKSEIRAVALAKLEIQDGQALWDLGAGCGSVGIEASLLNPNGRIVAVERDPQRIRHIEENRARFGVAILEIVQADLPEGMDDLPEPDRVFIGGGGKALKHIILKTIRRLKPDGVLVAAVARLESLHDATDVLRQCGFRTDISHLHVNRSYPLGGGTFMKPLNPVWLIRATRTKEGERH